MYHRFWIHSFAHGHLGCFQYLPIVNCASTNIGLHRFFWIGVSGFLGYNPSSRIAGSKGISIFSFLRKFHTVFHSGHNSLHSHQKYTSIYYTTLFSISSPTFVCGFVSVGHPDWCEVISHCSFNFHLWWLVMLSIFSCVSGPSVCPSWRTVCSSPLPIF